MLEYLQCLVSTIETIEQNSDNNVFPKKWTGLKFIEEITEIVTAGRQVSMSREPGGRGQAAGKQASCKQQDSTGLPMVAQWLRTCQPVQETWIRFLGWEDALEKETATHSSILAWEISWAEEPGGLHPFMEYTKSWIQL